MLVFIISIYFIVNMLRNYYVYVYELENIYFVWLVKLFYFFLYMFYKSFVIVGNGYLWNDMNYL